MCVCINRYMCKHSCAHPGIHRCCQKGVCAGRCLCVMLCFECAACAGVSHRAAWGLQCPPSGSTMPTLPGTVHGKGRPRPPVWVQDGSKRLQVLGCECASVCKCSHTGAERGGCGPGTAASSQDVPQPNPTVWVRGHPPAVHQPCPPTRCPMKT